MSENFSRRMLMFAARKNIAALIWLLAVCGVDLDAEDENDGKTALLEAVEHDAAGAVRMLLRCGAEVDKEDQKVRTPLMKAAKSNSAGAIKVLLDHGAKIEKREKFEDPRSRWHRRHRRFEEEDKSEKLGRGC